MRYDKERLKAYWMRNFEAECIRLGFPEELIHGKEHEQFWATANFYFTQLIPYMQAASKTYESYLKNYVNKENKK